MSSLRKEVLKAGLPPLPTGDFRRYVKSSNTVTLMQLWLGLQAYLCSKVVAQWFTLINAHLFGF